MGGPQPRSAAALLLPLGLAAVPYARMLTADYVWDDGIYLIAQLPHFHGVREAFFPPIAAMQGFAEYYYRPLIPLCSLLERALAARIAGAASAAWSHGVNVLMHVGVTALVILLVRALLPAGPRRTAAALAAATLFAVHPIHAEAVCSISGRTDLLATFFLLGAVLAAVRGREGRGLPFAALAALLFLLALLSKETALAGLVLVPAALWCFPAHAEGPAPRRPLAYPATVLALLLAALAGYAALRVAAGTTLAGGAPLAPGNAPLRALAALGWYVRKLVVPWPQLHFVVQLPPPGISAAVLAAAGLLLAAALRFGRASRPALLFPALWFLATLAPPLAVALRPVAANPVAERYLYLPSVALGLWVGQWVAAADFRLPLQRLAAALAVAYAVASAASVVERTGVWQDNLSFWSDAMRDPAAAENPIVRTSIGNAVSGTGRLAEARAHFERAYALFSSPVDRRKVLVNLASLDLIEAESSLARGAYEQARSKAGAAAAKLVSPLASELARDPQPNVFMGEALLVQAQAGARLTGTVDAELVRRSLAHLERARAVLPQDGRILRYRALAQTLLPAGAGR